MAKIHIKGGSPLRLEFEDDDENTLAVSLKPKGQGEYFVIDEATGKNLQAFPGKDGKVFKETNPNNTSCEVEYKGIAPAPATV
jgi:hypothetical protein